MSVDEAKTIVRSLQNQCEAAFEVARTAERNRNSLKGNNFYAKKFENLVIALTVTETKVKSVTVACALKTDDADELSRHINTLVSVGTGIKQRAEALKQIRLTCQARILPGLENLSASPVPKTEQILPLAVVQGTQTYLEKIIVQANGCFEHQWFDACSVMIRKFVEILIIEVYEANGKSTEIKGANGEFLMLRDLVGKILGQTYWNLGRETKKELPNIKSLGDRSAHNRRFMATKHDIEKVIPGLRVTADELLHLAKLK